MEIQPFIRLVCIFVSLVLVWGCYNPLDGYDISQIEREVISGAERESRESGEEESEKLIADGESAMWISDDRIRELDSMSGHASYGRAAIDTGPDLQDKRRIPVKMTLNEAVKRAVGNNLDVKIAYLVPQMSYLKVVEQEAAFDPEVFSQFDYTWMHEPSQSESYSGWALPIDEVESDTTSISAGVRSILKSGAVVTLSTDLSHVDDKEPGRILYPEPGVSSSVTLNVRQPLLRNFGKRVNLTEIRLAENTNESDGLNLNREMMDVVVNVESAYWELVYARQYLAIREQILDITIATKRSLVGRRDVDVSPLQLAQVETYVQMRRAEVISTQRVVADASDRLKQLMNSSEVPLAGEQIIDPTDLPDEQSHVIDLSEAISLSLKNRPEMGQALLLVEDTELRQYFAENQQKATLDLTATVSYFGLSDRVGTSYEGLGENDWADYSVGIEYSKPITDRSFEAVAGRMRLMRMAQVISYHRTAQGVVASTKAALRSMRNAYRLIDSRRQARRAAAENLRVLVAREESSTDLTPEFMLNLKLTTQQRVAEAQISESRAVIDYNIARAQLLSAIGLLLEDHGISKAVPVVEIGDVVNP